MIIRQQNNQSAVISRIYSLPAKFSALFVGLTFIEITKKAAKGPGNEVGDSGTCIYYLIIKLLIAFLIRYGGW